MTSDLTEHRRSAREQRRIASLFDLIPPQGRAAIDIGARDGYLSRRLADRYQRVVALDLVTPQVDDHRVECVQGDATRLGYADASFDLVLCSEVLEHIPMPHLQNVCREIARVASRTVVIGVPFRQDIRLGRTTCPHCSAINPPWGHVNSFDRADLERLFAPLRLTDTTFAGESTDATNFVSAALYDFAGNPYGTYSQDEPCIACGGELTRAAAYSATQRIASRGAAMLNTLQRRLTPPRGAWIHLKFEK